MSIDIYRLALVIEVCVGWGGTGWEERGREKGEGRGGMYVVHVGQQSCVLIQHFLLERGERFRVGFGGLGGGEGRVGAGGVGGHVCAGLDKGGGVQCIEVVSLRSGWIVIV